MNYRKIFQTLGSILNIEAVLMIFPLIVTLIYDEYDYVLSFIIPISLLLILGILFTLKKPKKEAMYAKDGFIIVGLSWVVLSLFGCLPFVLNNVSETKLSFIGAFFEIVSGFTTTGASVITNVDVWYEKAKGLLFWRSFSHWIGGMGVLVFFLAILPKSDGQSIFILKAESTGPQVGKLVSKIKVTARILYLIYLALTIIEMLFLVIDMPFYDAIVNSFATAGTGGFGIRSASIGYYSIYSQIVIAIFMLIFGVNFNIYYLLIAKKAKQALKSEELWWYLGIVFVSTVSIAINIHTLMPNVYSSLALAFKDSLFQVSSVITTTGFATANFENWPMLSQTILFILMFIGGCAGSTAGGIKVSRIVILLKSFKREIKKVIHPNSVLNVRFEGNTIDDEVVKGVTNYFGLIMVLLGVGLLILSFDKFDFVTNLTAITTCINNVGPGLGRVIGTQGSFASFSVVSKLVLSIAMLIGRLEIYPILILFNIKVWLKKQ